MQTIANCKKTDFSDLNPKKILVIAVPCMGDTFLALPLVNSLKTAFPDAQIDMLVRSGSAGIVKHAPEINEIICFDYKSKVLSYFKMLRRIFRKYDLAVSTSSSDRSILSCLYAAPKRASIVPPKRKKDWWKRRLLNAYVENDLSRHTVHQNLQLIDAINIHRQCNFKLTYPEQSNFELPEQYIVIHPLSQGEYKNFSDNFWKDVMQNLVSSGHSIVLTSGPAEKEVERIKEIASTFTEHVYNFAGKLSIPEVCSLIKSAQCFIGVDTCITHIAATLNVPTIALFGPSNTVKWSPWPYNYQSEQPPFSNQAGIYTQSNVTVVKGQCKCPNFPVKCRFTNTASRCIEDIHTQEVIKAFKNLKL